MKAKYLFLSLVATVALFTSCNDKYESTYLDNLQVSSSYVSIPVGGGQTTINITASSEWKVDTTSNKIPAWLTLSSMTGSAGTSTLTFSAASTIDGRNCELCLTSNDEKQYINVIQGLSTISTATCAEVINGVEGKTYQVTGKCTAIANTTYGNWYLNDGTGEIYVYGTVDGSGSYNWSKFNIEVGDEVTVQGARKSYNSTIEFVDAAFVSVSKSLIKVNCVTVGEDTITVLPLEGGDLTVHLTNKGSGVSVEVPEDAQDWLSIKSIDGNNVTFHAIANEGGDRSATLVFSTTSSGKEYTCQQSISQVGSIVDATVAEFNAAEVGNTTYRVTGIVSVIDNEEKGIFHIKDATGELYVYKMADFADASLKVGDIVTLLGNRGEYKGTIEMLNPTLDGKTSVEPISVADFCALEDDATKSHFYMLSGTVSNITSTERGNFDLVDETGSVYVYGLVGGWGGASKQFESFGIAEGDKITMLAYKSSYKGTIEACGGMLFSHTPANAARRK